MWNMPVSSALPTDNGFHGGKAIFPQRYQHGTSPTQKSGKAQRGHLPSGIDQSHLYQFQNVSYARQQQAEKFAKQDNFLLKGIESGEVKFRGKMFCPPPEMQPKILIPRPPPLTYNQQLQLIHKQQIMKEEYCRKIEAKPNSIMGPLPPISERQKAGRKVLEHNRVNESSSVNASSQAKGEVVGFPGMSKERIPMYSKALQQQQLLNNYNNNNINSARPYGTDVDVRRV
eukprot:PhF_6_TR31106/c0_g1_i2/m.45508